MLYIWENHNGADHYRSVTVVQGYYDVDSLATAVATAISTGRQLSAPYTGSYNPVSGRIEIGNLYSPDGNESAHFATEEALKTTLDISK